MNEEQSFQGGPKRSPWIIFAIIATAAMTLVVVFLIVENQAANQGVVEQEQKRRDRIAQLERGTSCRALSHAERALRREDTESLGTAILEARRRAEHALQTSGVLFGAPERHAMFLAEDFREQGMGERLRARLVAAMDACEKDAAS